MTLLTEDRQTQIHPKFYPYCNGKIIFDLGATAGDFTEIALANGAKKVYAFEPGPVSCDKLRSNFAGDERVVAEELAVSDEITVLKNVTWLNSWCLGNPNEIPLPVSPGACDIEGYDLIDIKTTTLDAYATEKGIEHVDIIKMDIDGYEYKALRGATKLLECRPFLYMELSFYVDSIEKGSVGNFIQFIDSRNYQFITHDGYLCSAELVLQEYPWHSSCDVFVIPKERLEDYSSLFNGVLE